MEVRQKFQKSIKKAILKLKNGSASSEEISKEFADAIDDYIRHMMEAETAANDSQKIS